MYKTKRSVAITSLFLLSTQKYVHCKYFGHIIYSLFIQTLNPNLALIAKYICL